MKTFARRGIQIHEIDRGGDVTYHGPGQIVGYPILDLRGEFPGKKGPHLGAVEYVRWLEEALIRTCAEYGVLTQRIAGKTGVWTLPGGTVPEKKIAAIGVHISQAITSHGFAWNVTTDLRDFRLIVPCGITDCAVTSLEEEIDPRTGAMPTMEQAVHAVARNFGRVFGKQILWTDSDRGTDRRLACNPMIDRSTFPQNGFRPLTKPPNSPVAAASRFRISSYRMVILGQFDSKIVPWRQGKQTFLPKFILSFTGRPRTSCHALATPESCAVRMFCNQRNLKAN